MKEPFISVLISEEKLNERIAQLGEQISKDYEGKEVKLICILKEVLYLHASLPRESLYLLSLILCRYQATEAGHHQAVRLRLRRILMRALRESTLLLLKILSIRVIHWQDLCLC